MDPSAAGKNQSRWPLGWCSHPRSEMRGFRIPFYFMYLIKYKDNYNYMVSVYAIFLSISEWAEDAEAPDERTVITSMMRKPRNSHRDSREGEGRSGPCLS